MLQRLFFLAIILIPFTSIQGLPFLGEIQHEVAAYLFLAMMGLSVLPVLTHFRVGSTAPEQKVLILPWIMAAMLGVIALSFATNFVTIKDSFFLGRSGIEKFISSMILVFYGFGIATMTYFLAARQAWDKLIVKPMVISVGICAVFSVFEMAGRMSGGMATLFQILSAPIYGTFDVLEWDTRLRSVAFEPPDFANTAGYIWPWLLGAVLTSRGAQRIILGAVWAVLNVMIVLSEARTSLVVIGGLLLVLAALLFVFAPKQEGRDPEKMLIPLTLLFFLIIPSALLVFSAYYDRLIYAVVAGENISNLSRLASITAALRMFKSSPIFGYGFGQFGFHVTQFMPSWGYYSWEVREWLFGSGLFWPSVYSVYARFAADMGIMGLLMWVGIWLWLARTLVVETLRYRKKTGDLPFAAIPLILSCFCVLFAGIPCDSVRAPMIWINMGLACRYLFTMKQWRETLIVKESETS